MVGLLAFAWQARRRGYNPTLLPGRVNSVYPDLCLWYGEPQPLYAEFETRARAKHWKWRRLGRALGQVHVCTFNQVQRRRMVAECLAARVDVRATDLETLLTTPDHSPLFVQD
jgi:hypothetical protein